LTNLGRGPLATGTSRQTVASRGKVGRTNEHLHVIFNAYWKTLHFSLPVLPDGLLSSAGGYSAAIPSGLP